MNIRVLALSVFCGAFAAASFGKTIYVSPEGAGNKDGTSPENAYAARDYIAKGKTVVSDDDTVKLLEGTYHETGTEWYAVQSRTGVVIEGDVANPAKVVFDGRGGNVRFFGVEKPSGGTAAEVTIRGVTFKNAKSGSNYQAIYVNNSMAYIEDCVFSCITNTGGNGAAIFFSNNNSTGEVRRCSFTDCAGPNNSGGAIARNNTSDYYTLYDCAFTNCTAKNAGGAQGVSIVERCKFVNCSVKDSNGGGAIWDNIDDAEIRGCDFVKCSSGNKKGGAIFLTANAKITGCTFDSCSASGDGGGGIYSGVQLKVDGCTFTNCMTSSNHGGAIRCDNKSLTLLNSNFYDCSAPTHGGAVYASAGDFLASNCVFRANNGVYGSGIGLSVSTSLIVDCEFADNGADIKGNSNSRGGAVCSNNNGSYEYVRCRFTGNAAYAGGCINVRSASPSKFHVTDCSFCENDCGVYNPTILHENTPVDTSVRNCLFARNTGRHTNGSMVGSFKGSTSLVIDNCTFTGNRSTVNNETSNHPLYMGTAGTVSNCIFWDNQNSAGTLLAVYCSVATKTISHVASDSGALTGEGNFKLSASPFKDAENGDYALAEKVGGEANPCLGTGLKLDWMTADSKDLAGNPRVRENDFVDLGCYAYFTATPKRGLRIIVR